MSLPMKSSLIWLLPLVSVIALASGQVWLSHLRYETAQQTQFLQNTKEKAKAEVARLKLEVASLTRPERLREIAGSKLGMYPPHPMQVVHP